MIGGTVGLVSSVGRAPDLQAGDRGFESCIGHTFSSLFYFNIHHIHILHAVFSNIRSKSNFRDGNIGSVQTHNCFECLQILHERLN